MSDPGNTSIGADKENLTPSYRSKLSLISSYLEDRDVSGISEVSDYVPNNLNSTTTKLNRILERVNVSDHTQLSELNKSDDAFSEVSFDIAPEMKIDEYKAFDIAPEMKIDEYKATSPRTDDDKNAATTHSGAKTPNLRRNPFDISTIEHFPDISPNVFITRDPEQFSWGIDHIAEMNPAEISDDQPSYILEAQKHEYDDPRVQQTVKSYFESCVIAPSPCIRKTNKVNMSVMSAGENKECQTNISLPWDFDLESFIEEKHLLDQPEKLQSESSFRRMLFNSETPRAGDRGELEVVEFSSEPDYNDDLQHSPAIPMGSPAIAYLSPLSGSEPDPSFLICNDENGPPLSPIGSKPISSLGLSPINAKPTSPLLSPIISKPTTSGNMFRTPARPSPVRNQQSTPGIGGTPVFLSTPGHAIRRSCHQILMSTPAIGLPNSPNDDAEPMEMKTPGPPSSKRKLTPDKNGLFKNSQFSGSPFISPIPRSLSYNIRRHPKCPKKARFDSPRFADTVSPVLSPASSAPSPVGSVTSAPSPADSLVSPDSLIPKQVPMESSRIESGTDVSSEGEREKTKLVAALGIQPLALDISAIKVQDNTKKLRTNNYLNISDKNEFGASFSPRESDNTCDNNTGYSTDRTGCSGWKDEVRSKDSGFGTSSAMSNIATSTLPPLSEISCVQLLESRPGKRKKFECSPQNRYQMMDESGLQPPPVKRVVIAEKSGGRRKHRSLE